MPIVVIPGYAEACVRERTLRIAAFADVPRSVCGVDVWQPTVANLFELELLRSPFLPPVDRASVNPMHIAALLWLCSHERRKAESLPAWLPFRKRAQKAAERRLGRIIGGLAFATAIAECADFAEAAFMDLPRGGGGGGKSYFCWAASLVGTIASAFGWGEREIMAMPVSRAAQYHRIARLIQNPETILFNPSDSVAGDYLRKLSNDAKHN